MTAQKEQITKLVRETLEKIVIGEDDQSLREEVAREISIALGDMKQIDESFFPTVEKLMAKGIDRYRFVFLERGEDRWIIVKTGNNIKAINFSGNTLVEHSHEFATEQEVEIFVSKRKEEKYKIVTRDSGLLRFFKAIGRGLGVLIVALGVINTIAGVFLLLMVLIIGPSVLATIGYAGMGVGAYAGYSIAGDAMVLALAGGGGWLMMKINKKQFNADYAEKMAQ